MPLFRYVCNDCQNEFELLQPRYDAPARCPKCGSANNARQLNRIGGIKSAGPAGCANRNDCPSSGGHHCCEGGCCHGHH